MAVSYILYRNALPGRQRMVFPNQEAELVPQQDFNFNVISGGNRPIGLQLGLAKVNDTDVSLVFNNHGTHLISVYRTELQVSLRFFFQKHPVEGQGQ